MTDQLAKARELAMRLGYGDEFFAKGGELEDWSAAELVGLLETDVLTKAGGPYIGPRGGKWADPQHTIPWEAPTAPKPKNKRSHEPSDYEPPTDRMTDEAALQALITLGDNLYANQEHGVEDAVGFSSYDCSVWHSVAAQADASNPASMHRLRALIGKYKRQITGGHPEHLDEFYRLGLQDALQKKSEHKGARILSRYTVDGTLLLPMAGRVGDFNAYREINKQFGVRVRKDANGAWQNYVPPPHSGKFDADGYTAKMAEIGVLVEDFPEAKPAIADAPPENPSVQSAPQGGGSKMGADAALEAIRRRAIDNTVVVKYLTEGKHAGKVGFWSTFSLDFNAIMGNKSTDPRAITGIVEVDKDMGWVRLVDNVPLMEEALGKLKQHLPKHTFIVDANVDEWKAKLAKTVSERQAPIPELIAKLTPEIKPYPFQNEAVRFFQANDGNGLLGDEMGLGKTLEALAYAAVEDKRTLVVCPKVVRGNWLREAKRFFPGHFDNVKELTTKALKKEGLPDLSQVKIATINYEILEKFMPAIEAAGFDLMVVDECFGPETLVDTPYGPRRIDQIREGDEVLSALGIGKVLGTMRRQILGSRVELSYGGRSIVCSENHPFFTERGWVSAGQLQAGDHLVTQQEAVRLLSNPLSAAEGEGAFLRNLLLREVANESARDSGKNIHSATVLQSADGQPWEEEPIKLAPHDAAQSDAECRDPGQGISDFAGDGMEAYGSSRERDGTDHSRGYSAGRSGRSVDLELRRAARAENPGVSDQLQARHRRSSPQGGDRSGWGLALFSERAGPQESGKVGRIRVDSAEVHQSGRYGENPDGHYYDLEIDGHPSFSVGGALVHNSHRVKNPKAALTKNVQRIAKGVKHKILLSGTALKNKREELYTQLQLVRPGFVTKDELKSGMIGALHHKLSEIYLARKKRDVVTDMPEKVKQVVHLEVPNLPKLGKQGLTPEDLADLTPEERSEIEDEGGGGGGLDEVTWIKHATAKAKAPVTAEFVSEILDSSDSLVLVFTDSKAAARSIVEKLGPVAVIHTGDQTDQAADDARAHFDPLRRKEGDSVRVLVSTTTKGIGFNAQLADKVIFNDLPWTPADKDQAEDRAYRIGTKKTVNVYDVVAEGHPFDQAVLAILDRKRILAKKLMDGVKLTPEEKSWIDNPITRKDLLAMLKGQKVGPVVNETQTVVSAAGDTITAPVQKSLFTIRPDDELCKAGPYIGPKGGLWADPQHTQHWDPTQHAAPSGPKRAEDVLFNDVPLGLVPQKVAAMLALPDLEFARVASRFDNYVKRLGGKVPASMARWSQILELARAGRPEAKTEAPQDIPPPLVATELPTAVVVPPPALQPVDDAAKMGAQAVAEQVAEAKAPKKSKGKSKKNLAKIESTGDHIWGSRYDLAQMERITSSEQLSGMAYDDAVKIVTKRHLVPAHSLQTLKALGMSPGTAHLTLALLSSIVAKPDDSPAARAKYVDEVHEVLAATLACKTRDDFKKMLTELEHKQRSAPSRELVATYETKAAALAAADQLRKDDPKGSYTPVYHHMQGFAVERGVMRPLDSLGDRFSGFVSLRGKVARDAFYTARVADGAGGYFGEKTVADGWAYLEERGAKAQEKAKTKAELRAQERAMNAAVGAEAETERGWSGAKSVSGVVVREGHTVTVKDADPQRVKSTFHLKEVDFGQEGYMTQADREYHVKELEGALHDFAEILGVDPDMLSFSGRLGIALGARGRGPHRAHYESGRFVINITKFAGGGTLAHEWGHALDNILAKVYNPKAAADAGGMFLSSAPQASYWPEDVRKAYAAVHEAMYAHPNVEKAKADRSAELVKLRDEHAKLVLEMNTLTKRRQELHRKPTAEKLPLYVNMAKRNIEGWESQRKGYEEKLANAKGTGSKLQYTSFIADLDRCLAEERPRLAAFQKGEGVRTEAETKEYEDLKGREELLRQDINRAAEKHDTLRRKTDPTRSLYAQSASLMGEYWHRPQEMFARAFESFVEDKLERMERKSTYLVDGTRNQYHVGKIGSASIEPYPQGEERERIFLAMAAFLKTLHSAGHLAKALTHMRFLLAEDTLQKADFDHTKEIADADGMLYERVKKLAMRREYTARDFDVGGVLYGWSTNEILDLLRDG